MTLKCSCAWETYQCTAALFHRAHWDNGRWVSVFTRKQTGEGDRLKPCVSMIYTLQGRPYSPSRDCLIENLKCWAELVFIHQKCVFSKEKRHSESFCSWRASFPYQGICTSIYTLPCCVLKGFPAQPNMNMLAEFSSWGSAFQHL